jgi:hypothetical protein
MPQQPIQTVTLRLRKNIAASLEEMWEQSRPYENKLTIEMFATQLLEQQIADFRCKKISPAQKLNYAPCHYRT